MGPHARSLAKPIFKKQQRRLSLIECLGCGVACVYNHAASDDGLRPWEEQSGERSGWRSTTAVAGPALVPSRLSTPKRQTPVARAGKWSVEVAWR